MGDAFVVVARIVVAFGLTLLNKGGAPVFAGAPVIAFVARVKS